MPVKIKKVNGYRVSTPSGVKSKGTTKEKAERQANLLRAVEHLIGDLRANLRNQVML